MSHNHFTLGFALKSAADAKAVAEELPPLMPALFRAEDAIGTIHYSRFTVLSEKTLLFLGDFDGEFSQLMADLGKHAGPVFEAIFQHVDDPQADGAPAIKITGFSNFVTTKAAAYCFLLSITAIKFIAKLG
jgi:hypothetical protein